MRHMHLRTDASKCGAFASTAKCGWAPPTANIIATSTRSTQPHSPRDTDPAGPGSAATMSRFFTAVDSSSESSSDEENLYSEEEEEEQSEEESSEEEDESEEESSDEDEGKTGAGRFLRDVSDESDSDDEDRVTVVKSAKDKRFEELEATIKAIENAEKINDWAVIATGELRAARKMPRFCILMLFSQSSTR